MTPAFDTLREHFSLSALKTATTRASATETQLTLNGMDQFRADAERLSHIILEMQRCFVLHLCKELAPGNVSFPQFFLLAALDHKEVLTMSAIAQKMGHTTAAASGLVARLENLGYVVRSSAREDRRKVMVCITRKRLRAGAAHPRRNGGQRDEGDEPSDSRRAERRGSRFTARFTITARRRDDPPLRSKSRRDLLMSRRFENGTR